MATVRFHLASTPTPAEAVRVLTDFGPTRPEPWPSIDADHFVLHGRRETWAEITAAAWERSRHQRDPASSKLLPTSLPLIGPPSLRKPLHHPLKSA
ncbi:hypothetical protein [Nocardia sp. NPDC057030]|uniref:hypothetical protein n=1 Tax=unclassified Nocardia TaxID=2637762 RepID=UPI0036370A49